MTRFLIEGFNPGPVHSFTGLRINGVPLPDLDGAIVVSFEPAECGCIPGHRVLVTTNACADCGMTEREFVEHGNRPCARGLWPRDVLVPPRPVLGLRFAPLGTEEGDLCLRSHSGLPPCLGKLELLPFDSSVGCYCSATRAPCSSCSSWTPECPVCGHREPEA